MLPDNVYNVLKWIDLTFIPAFIVFFGVLGSTLNIPNTEIILTILGAFDVFLGSLLGISSVKYAKKKEDEE